MEERRVTPVMIVHGGAWSIPEFLVESSAIGVRNAVRAGYGVLEKGGSAVDAVVAAVLVLEDDPSFDAGTGSVLNADGDVEMDAVIMDGSTLETGAVACVHNIQNPILLAREVMEKTGHTMIVGIGANKFAEEVGIKKVPTETLVSPEAIRELECFKQYGNTVEELFKRRNTDETIGHDTVGAVAMDAKGNVAVGTSTGGITAKRPGRVGDSPIVGLGAYSDNEVGGVSCTGHGESIAKVCLAFQITALMRQGLSAQEAADKALASMGDRVNGFGGVIVVGRDGAVAKSFTTERMSWAWAKDGVLHYGINNGEDFQETVHQADDSD